MTTKSAVLYAIPSNIEITFVCDVSQMEEAYRWLNEAVLVAQWPSTVQAMVPLVTLRAETLYSRIATKSQNSILQKADDRLHSLKPRHLRSAIGPTTVSSHPPSPSHRLTCMQGTRAGAGDTLRVVPTSSTLQSVSISPPLQQTIREVRTRSTSRFRASQYGLLSVSGTKQEAKVRSSYRDRIVGRPDFPAHEGAKCDDEVMGVPGRRSGPIALGSLVGEGQWIELSSYMGNWRVCECAAWTPGPVNRALEARR
ncbi:hypothetical protein BU23DRAFT_572713 [Bimuria novae-zelandiae CBS 107.79]|uniref:Uncharacterized protein n=1 Tax=Bimuria novae-zelandiae CBS 107.79 TaxID=1447943 RepID=A0A6A5UT84_9PLEO|nr:hypothetical protein BU23DRAFT_572713 [Bimuria novae-zelandiae CBS 107.79]